MFIRLAPGPLRRRVCLVRVCRSFYAVTPWKARDSQRRTKADLCNQDNLRRLGQMKRGQQPERYERQLKEDERATPLGGNTGPHYPRASEPPTVGAPPPGKDRGGEV